MAGIIAVYSLVISVLIASDLEPPPGANYSLFKYVSIYITKNSKRFNEIFFILVVSCTWLLVFPLD